MTKCGKSFLPECEYFATNGCVSPFNCPYKVENESITTATSTPCNLYPLETDKDKEISRLTAEVAELRARLEKAVELPVKVGDWVYCIDDNRIIGGEVNEIRIEEFNTTITFVRYDFDGEYIGEWYVSLENYNKTWFTTRAEAEARLKELQGGER